MNVKSQPRPLTKNALKRIQIAERDDSWECHYCGIDLVPENELELYARYEPDLSFWDHCGCGKHILGGGPEPMPCVLKGGWVANRGLKWGQIDHKTPRCLGGTDDLENLVLSCGDCNSRKGRTPYEEFVGKVAV